MTEGSEQWFWHKLAHELGLPLQFCKVCHTVDEFFEWIDYFIIENERKFRREVSHEKLDHLAARICLEIERLAYKLSRVRGVPPNNMKKHYVQYVTSNVPVNVPPEPENPDDVVARTIRHKAAMFAALGMNQQAKWEGPLPDGYPK